jgi:TRAP-type C4-dicarboxylate transport system permease large subunit
MSLPAYAQPPEVRRPVLVPLGQAYGINPIQLGVIFLANMELGYLTPRVGLNVYMASYRFGKSVPAVFRAVLPIIIVLHIGVLLITYVPISRRSYRGYSQVRDTGHLLAIGIV